MRFENKIVLVTGGASGIGLAAASLFIAEGATVIATDINADALEKLTLEGAGSLVPRVSDAGCPTAIAELSQWVEAEFGRLDVLVNNAGFAVMKNPEDVTEAEYHAQMNVMLTGPVFYVKHFAGLLRKSSNGSVINISSGSALISSNGYCPYALAKAAIIKLSEDSAVQVPGIRHNAVLPGFVETPILHEAYGEDAVEQLGAMLTQLEPVKRMGQPEDIASSIAFLASDEASYINGTSLLVDGGMARLNTATALAGGLVSLN
jgi:NAD(P)-dependent dehydrogenase (short-subunit alcohol dehydrogenase family)